MNNPMDRREVIQKIIDATGAKRYLEIGVFQGTTFLQIKCRHKSAVDPDFRISPRARARWVLRNLGSRFYQMMSGDFFARYRSPKKFGVAFIDGLHSYAGSLADLEKTLGILDDGGVIIMHDCNPPTAAAETPADSWYDADAKKVPGWTGEWNGDVWKTIARIRSERDDLSVFVLDTDYGLGIITRGKPEKMLGLTPAEIHAFTYADLDAHRAEWLDLKPIGYLDGFLALLSES
jgi:predicted O-methyltransferase YrrM